MSSDSEPGSPLDSEPRSPDGDQVFVSASDEEEKAIDMPDTRKDTKEFKALARPRDGIQTLYVPLQAKIVQWDKASVSVQEIKHTLAELGELTRKITANWEKTYNACESDDEWKLHEPDLTTIKEGIKKSQIDVQTLLDERTATPPPPPPPPPPGPGQQVPQVPHVTVTPYREKVDLPKFDGTFSKWIPFRDLFDHKVNVERITSGASKLALLLTKVTGDAASIISSYSPTDANFDAAWDALCERFDNKKEIAYAHLREFYHLKPQVEESALSIRKVLDTLNETARSIENLGAPNTPDLMYIFLALMKLDKETQKWWALQPRTRDFPDMDDFTKFLEQRATALMQFTSSSSSSSKSKSYTSSSHYSNTEEKRKCVIHDVDSHVITTCQEFLDKSVQERRDFIQGNRRCFNCLKGGHFGKECKSPFSCQTCQQRHHTMLHPERAPQAPPAAPAPAVPVPVVNSSHCTPTQAKESVVLLGTILAHINDSKGQPMTVRVFVDSGSESHFISEGCMARLGLQRRKTCVALRGIGGVSGPTIKGEVSFCLKSRTTPTNIPIEALIIPQISGLIPKATCRSNWSHFKGIQLSDPQFARAAPVDVLLGAKKAHHILVGEIRTDLKNPNAPIAVNTKFGWMITGESPQVHPSSSLVVRTHHVSCTDSYHDLDNSLTKFWELEEPTPLSQPLSAHDVEAEKHFLQTMTKNQDGSYTVRLPFKATAAQLGNSRDSALSRFHKLEVKLQRQPEIKKEYSQYLAKYKDLGFLESVPDSELKVKDSESYYIPHHVVIKPSSTSTPYRVVFDASMKTTTGISLNDALLTGPKLQIDLQPLLTRFRSHQVAMSADIPKFYPQTHVHKDDRNYQRFFWRENPQEPLQTLRMTRVTVGLTCAPFLAIRALHHLAEAHASQFPKAAQVMKDEFLVDNLLSGAHNTQEALLLQSQLLHVFGQGNMTLLKWASNDPEVLQAVPPEARDPSRSLNIGELDSVKTIGLNWHPHTDQLSLCIVDPDPSLVTTKRSVLSVIARTFDPQGWISPVTVRAKSFMQKLWAKKLDWDEPIPMDLHRIWRKYTADLTLLHQFSLDRNILKAPHSSSTTCTYQLHGFCDSSDIAYAACAYARTQDEKGRVSVKLVASRTKVNPVNGQTTPRSELCGALLLCHLMESIQKSLPHVQCQSTHLWTDSTVVLGRINPELKLPVFELNRVIKILALFPSEHWSHVKGEENPADCASRGIPARELLTHPLWLHGPPWLTEGDPPAVNVSSHVTQQATPHRPISNFINDCSSLWKMRRVVAHWLRYISNLKSSSTGQKRTGPMSRQELDSALLSIVKIVQEDEFSLERLHIQKHPNSSPDQLKHLAPFLDEMGILRVGGRLKNLVAPEEKKHPALLPKAHNFVDVLARYLHVTNLHAGPNLLLSLLREKYWIIRGPDLAKRTVKSCITCLRHSAAPSTQLMAHLPPSRVNSAPAFYKTGVDYAGPYLLMLRTGRKPPMTKAYVSLFVCMVTKAIHLELVHDLSTEAFLAALTRFVSRRGKPDEVFCDGGTNFVGAKRELQEITALLQDPTHQHKVQQAASKEGITFNINPPASPHHGGLWEAGVKSMKTHLRRVMGDRHLTVSEFSTLLTQVEAVLNSRPLTTLSSDPNDLSALTPGHFLIGRPLVAVPQLDSTEVKESRLDRWQRVQQLSQHFWKRWSQEYLSLLQSRPKWLAPTPNLQVGMLVLLRTENNAFAPQKWQLGRIVQTHPGSDGIVRVCDVKTNVTTDNPHGTILRRPIVKISPLPFYD